jgi:hypothetical protein
MSANSRESAGRANCLHTLLCSLWFLAPAAETNALTVAVGLHDPMSVWCMFPTCQLRQEGTLPVPVANH